MTTSHSVTADTSGQAARWWSTKTWGSARWQRGLAAAFAALILWPQASVDPVVGPDPSWQAGLALARTHHLAWGTDIIFTYGPLGFLQNIAYYSFSQSLLASFYQPLVVAGLFLGITKALRLRHAPMTSLINALITTGIVAVLHIGHGWGIPGLGYPELAVLTAFVWASIPLLEEDPERPSIFITCNAIAALAGFQLLVKFNTGLTIMLIGMTVSLLAGWRNLGRHCATAATFVASIVLLWILAGQRLSGLTGWLKSSIQITGGYSSAMAMPLSADVLVLAAIGALVALFIWGHRAIPARFTVLVAILTAAGAKAAFSRLDLWHSFPLLSFIVLTVVITPLSGVPKTARRTLAVIVAAVVGLGYASAVAGTVVFGYPDRTVAAVKAPAQTVDRVGTLLTPGRLERRIEKAKAHQRALYAIPEGFIKAIGDETVHVDPAETSVVWAYSFTWHPVPVFQTYASYSTDLDRLNSESLSAGPQFVLSRLSSASPATGIIDGRLGVQESPRYARTLLCNYVVAGVEGRWALFTRSASRCGPLIEVSQVDVRANDVVTVPTRTTPNTAVLVGIDLHPTLIDRLFEGTVASLTIPTIALDGVPYRLIAANAAEPVLINTPADANGTNLEINAHTIGIGRVPSFGQSGVVARLHFYEMSLEP